MYSDNTKQLRHLFIAYAIIKGKEYVKPKHTAPDAHLVKILVSKYTPVEV